MQTNLIRNRCLRMLFVMGVALQFICLPAHAQFWNPSHAIGTITGKYNFTYNQAPDQLVEIRPAAIFASVLTYQWESSPTPMEADFTPISAANGGTFSSFTPGILTQTTYYRRKTISLVPLLLGAITTTTNYSNIIKISIVSVNWEDLNYIREHDVNTTGIMDWKTVDQLPIGQKLQTTTYLDGLGRLAEKISRETGTPAPGNSQWGDEVQFSKYDVFGREPSRYLTYTTATQSGKFKTDPLTEQPQYYTNLYNETSAFSSVTFDNSPLNRVMNVKESGGAWAASAGSSAAYDMNTAVDNVQLFYVDYVQGDAPIHSGPYPANTLYKLSFTDASNKQVVEYIDLAGRTILKKVQLDGSPSTAHAGWICTYNIYDDFGQLAFQLQPEAVKYLDANGWSFSGTDGPTVLAEQCFQYSHDDKGRAVWKKSPGAAPINMLYDIRDRMVFMQDGNQAALPTPQWTTWLYDELDRSTITALYNTTETIGNLQTDINNAVGTSSVYINTPGPAVTDLVIDHRLPGIARYAARNSISFVTNANGSFQSGVNDQFVAEIDPAATTGGSTVLYFFPTLRDPIASSVLNDPAVTTIVKYRFYDNYNFVNAKPFDNNFTNTTAYSNADPNVQPILPSSRTTDLPTGSLTRVLGTSTFLAVTTYYDEEERHIQTLEDNIKSGVDITTLQYYFDGRAISACSSHSAPGTAYSGFTTLTKYLFDKLGRVTSLQKQFGGNAFKTILAYDYDDMGRVKTKHLDQSYTTGGNAELESLNYSFNIHGQLTGINKDYALKTTGSYNKWGHFFGLYLGYDNRDNVFSNALVNGQVTGELWNSQGDDAQRRYDYSYDNATRLINAAYNEQQHPGDGWNSGKMDFSVTGSSGQITYDLNGNLLTMLQKGVMPGQAAPITVDDLHYAYAPHSNKLQSVTDQMTATNFNGLSGDFKDGGNAAGSPDYVYDANGNLVVDLNKNLQSLNNGGAGAPGVSYNFLDKPEKIRIVGKGTIQIVYSADGQKLKRIYTPENGGTPVTTTYINEFVYQAIGNNTDQLAYINFDEGRVRTMQPVSQDNGYDALSENGNMSLPDGKMGAYDYYVRDYQHNVRMILTEETHGVRNTCTVETGRASAEDPVFGQTGAANEVESTRYPTPPGWQSINSSASVSRLGNLAGHNIGPNTLQKVMVGDQVSATVQYYYQSPSTSGNPNIIPNVLSSLAGALNGGTSSGALVKSNASAISSQLNNTPGFVTAVEPSNSTSGTPQAYLTILFFDERFNFVEAADGGVAQQQVDPTWTTSTAPLGLVNIKAPKNGYAFVYVSNRSDQDVYFDNLMVGITAGNIIEEDHYYPYGLRIAAISSRKMGDAGEGTLKNSYLYNDKELFDDADLNWYDYGFRNYDPQIARFVQLDPLTDDYPEYTPYQYAGCEPIANVDLDGLEPAEVTSFMKTLNASDHATAALSQGGKVAGSWTVRWTTADAMVHAKIFKAAAAVTTVAKATNNTAKVVSVALKVVDVVTDFVPIVGGVKDIYKGIKSGNWLQAGLGLGSLVADVFTLGGSSIVKGAIKTVVKEGTALLVKEGTEQVVKEIVVESVAKKVAAKGAAEQATKGGVYVLKDGDVIVRTGRAKDLVKREAQHFANKETKHLTFHAIYHTDVYAEQRGLEHVLYETFWKTAAEENGGLNKVRAISEKVLKDPKKGQRYINAAINHLKKLGP